MNNDSITAEAFLSSCQRYRYSLGRHWQRSRGYVLFIGLNPSTADAMKDDPTIRRCIGFARSWGYGGLEMCNLYDWRATDPRQLRRALGFALSDVNDRILRAKRDKAQLIVACWGNVPWAEERIRELYETVFEEERRWHCLGFTKNGYPRHPLRLPKVSKPQLFW